MVSSEACGMIPEAVGQAARSAQRWLAEVDGDVRRAVLRGAQQILMDREADILEANRTDIAETADLPDPIRARLSLSPSKLDTLRSGLLRLADMPDAVGVVHDSRPLDHGLGVERVATPVGVVLTIFESRPDAVVQIAGICLKAGCAVIMKPGRESMRTSGVLVQCMRQAVEDVGLRADAVALVKRRPDAVALLKRPDLVDLAVPRGSGDFVRWVQREATVPVLGHADGVCSVYIDENADVDVAIRVVLDGKTDYPAACNATEVVLVHQRWPGAEALDEALIRAGVRRHAATWVEYGSLDVGVEVVSSLSAAIDRINRLGSHHTDAIVTDDPTAADRFVRCVDSASVMVNASTRLADGFRYGLGAELGIATSRFGPRGPVGVGGLLTHRWVVRAEGRAVGAGAGDYGEGKRQFLHEKESA